MTPFVIREAEERVTCKQLIESIGHDVYLVCNGKLVSSGTLLEHGHIYHVCPRLRGGKGGFGSMLRTIGAQIEKTTNRESMRDLSGRRMRDINNEKKLAEWVAGAADREREKEEKRKERLEKRRAEAEGRMYKFRDEKYTEQKEAVSTNLDDALTQGLKRAATSSTVSAPVSKKGKGKAPSASMMMGAGLDISDLSSSDEEDGASQSPPQSSSDSVTCGAEPTPEAVPEPEHESTAQSTAETAGVKACDDPSQSLETGSKKVQTDIKTDPELSSEVCQAGSKQKTNVDTEQSKSQDSVKEPIELDRYDSAEDLEVLGLEHLKNDLIRRGLKCGGSLQERAQRLFSVKGLVDSEIDPALIAKKGKTKKKQ